MSRILITGSAGFIGSHLADRLIELGHEVIGIDNLSTGLKENINPKSVFIKADITDLSRIYIDKPIDYIFHLAAIPRVPYSIEHPQETHFVNITGTLNVLELARNLEVKKVIFASSSSVYGDQELPFRETAIPHPKSPYAFQKLVGEGYMKLYNELYSLPTVSLRFFNVYGPRARGDSDYSLVIGKFLRLKKEGKALTIYGDGNQTRDFTYVSDIVDGCVKAMDSDVQNENINLCCGKNVSINGLAILIGGEKHYFSPRKGDPMETLGDNSKAKELLNWQPKIQIKEGIKFLREG